MSSIYKVIPTNDKPGLTHRKWTTNDYTNNTCRISSKT
jgi:hypothetical protein